MGRVVVLRLPSTVDGDPGCFRIPRHRLSLRQLLCPTGTQVRAAITRGAENP